MPSRSSASPSLPPATAPAARRDDAERALAAEGARELDLLRGQP